MLFTMLLIKQSQPNPRVLSVLVLAPVGLIDYNFHCFRKAIHEVFEVGMSSTRTLPTPTGTPCLMKGVTLNGTPRSTV